MSHDILKAESLERSWKDLVNLQSTMLKDDVSRETTLREIQASLFLQKFKRELWLKLEAYAETVLTANQRINLVSRKAPAEQILDNILDGLLLGVLIHSVSRETRDKILLIDAGTGSGVPGIPAQMALSQLRSRPGLLLVDSQLKKQDFLDALIRNMDLDDTLVFRGRLENPRLRGFCEQEWPDFSSILCTKAFAGLEQTIRWARPLRGYLESAFLIKGPSYVEEVEGFPFERRDWSLEAIHHCRFPQRESYVLELASA